MGGEKSGPGMLIKAVRGSPPHGRGKVFVYSCIILHLGITPAWAGKRKEKECKTKQWRDHPRMGGEKHLFILVSKLFQGSPPHGRGKGGAK